MPLLFLVLFGSYTIIEYFLPIPNFDELIVLIREYIIRYGYFFVLCGAFAEGLLFINWYLPGSMVAVFGVVFAKEAGLNPVLVVLMIIIGFFITTIINYFLGKYGWYRIFLKLGLRAPLERTKTKVETSGLSIILSTYIHPNIGALTATSAGILQYSFRDFLLYSTIAIVVWNVVWGVVVYYTGPLILELLTTWTVIGILVIWMMVLGYRYYKKKQQDHISIP